MASTKLNIVKGKTLAQVIRWETKPVVRKPITAIDLTTGAPRIEASGHGCPNGWRGFVFGVKGTKELNVDDPDSVASSDYHEVTVIDANHIEFNEINAANFTNYQAGGFFAYNSPKDLTGYSARVKIKDSIGGSVLLSTEAADSPKNLITATVDNTAKTITISISAATTAAIDWSEAVWEVEMVNGAIVEPLIPPSTVTVTDEVVT